MKKTIFLTVITAVLAISFAAAQDVDKILDAHFKAIGQKNLLKTNTLKATGKAMIMGMESPFTMYSKRPDKIRVVVEFQGSQIIQGYDGETAWMINPMMGSSSAVEISGPEADGIIESADKDGLLWKYKEKGHQVELEGTEEVNGRQAYVLKMTKKNGNIARYYIDKENYLMPRMTTQTEMNGMPVDVDVQISDYREVGGFKMPFNTDQRIGGQSMTNFIIGNVEINMDLEDSLFSKPD